MLVCNNKKKANPKPKTLYEAHLLSQATNYLPRKRTSLDFFSECLAMSCSNSCSMGNSVKCRTLGF